VSRTNRQVQRASVLGVGQIGGSIMLRLAELNIDVVGWDPDQRVCADARAMGLNCENKLDKAVTGSNIIFLAGPLSALPTLLEEVIPIAGPDCTITDVGSTKTDIVTAAKRLGCVNQFIGGHPMAGTEAPGITAANPDLFRGAAWVLALEKVEELGSFRTLANLLLSGFGVRLVPLAAHHHDETVALSSHLPHILAGGLANSVSRSPSKHSILSLAAGSFRDGTRVASTIPERTTDMLWHNRRFLKEDVHAFRQILDVFAKAVEQEDQSQLQALFEEAFRLRQELLTRNMRQFREKFDLTFDQSREMNFLCEVGMIGGHITECELTDTMIAYGVWLPSQSV